ncbi:MAG: AAA family ATPase, partial [Treponema sp.]|nr:AAA family ATPase [Treponema sp.]
MERFLISELEKWKHKKNRKPMVLMGARQVGKTWLMKTFGERNYKKVAYISFYNNQAMKNIFESDYDIKRILPYLNIEVGFSITPEDTLIIFDEIQNAPKAFESLTQIGFDAVLVTMGHIKVYTTDPANENLRLAGMAAVTVAVTRKQIKPDTGIFLFHGFPIVKMI